MSLANKDGTISSADLVLQHPWFSVKDFGARGDGNTDDTTAIRDADKAAAAVSGGTVFYPASVTAYRVTAPITPSAGVTHRGAGKLASIVTVKPADFGAFSFSYIFVCTNANVTIVDLGIDGQKRNGANPANQCGGIAVGPTTRLEGVRVDDPNYFGIWIGSTALNARVIDCRSARGGNNDSIGGGGGSDVKIIRHVWESTLAGNRFDNVGGTRVILKDCVDYSANAGGVYFEGMTHSGARGCHLVGSGGAGITIQSDAGYAPATCTNPLECFATDNTILSGNIQLSYDQAAATPANKGGYNTIRGNTVETAPTWGILLLNGSISTHCVSHDVVEDNTVINPNANNTAQANDGLNTVYVGAIVLDTNGLVTVRRNRTIDTWVGGPRTQMPVTTNGAGSYYLEDNDFGPSQFGVDPQGGAVVYARKNVGWNPQGIATITVTASPFTYIAGPSPETVYIKGGTVSNVTKGGTSLFVASPATVSLGPNEAVVVTYSVAPTMVKDLQ